MGPKDSRIWYIDNGNIIKFRQCVFGSEMGLCPYTNIECDLYGDYKENKWMDKLVKTGFDCNKKTIWICEEIVQYLEYKKIVKLLNCVNMNSCNGSWLIGECPNVINVQNKDMHNIWVNLGGGRAITGFDVPKQDILDKFGFTEYQEVNPLGTLSSNYKDRAPASYVNYQTATKPKKGDKVTRILLFRGMKGMKDNENKLNDENDLKSPL